MAARAMSAGAPEHSRVADVLWRRDMLGPTFGKLAGAVIGLLLVETLAMEYAVPLTVPYTEVLELAMGRKLFVFASAAVGTTVVFWGLGLLMALPALLKVEKWKIQRNRSLDVGALRQALPLILLNHLQGVVVAPLALLTFLPESSFDMRQLPSVGILTRDIVIWMLCQEATFFYVHRWLHENKTLYAKIHKIHHTWTAPVSIVAIYCHPVEHLISNLTPPLLGPILCGSHAAAISVFTFTGLVHTLAVHSGYWFCDDNGMHDEHHRKFNVNYGVFGCLDSWYGSYHLPEGAAGATSQPVPEKKVE